MRRFLCFSLCLGLMVSACKKKSLEESVNKAIAKAGGGAGSGSGGGDGGTTVKKHNKEAVLKACLPLINTKLIEKWGDPGSPDLFLRRSTAHITTAAAPLVVLYTGDGLPLEFAAGAGFGLGKDKATVTENLNKMAVSKVIQDQFVARDGNASGWRVHISQANTNVDIPQSANGKAPEVPESHKGKIIIYDRLNVVDKKGRATRPINARTLDQANTPGFAGGWFECVVNDTTEAVTFKYTDAKFTEA